MKILLFDIDGTLVHSGGAGKLAMGIALREAFGITDLQDVVPYSGRTDPAIGMDLLRVHNLPTTPENLTKLTDTYLNALPGALKASPGIVLPGVVAMLEEFSQRKDVLLGLLTGNVLRGGRVKLSHYQLWDYFAPVGGFGDGRAHRDDVARAALTNAEAHMQTTIRPDSVWVIGDTPHDITCARAIGARVLAVATGWHTMEELHAYEADLTVKDLTQPGVIEALLG